MRESDPDKVLDHAAAAYQRGDLEKAKEIYAYIEQGGGTEHRDGNVRKSSAVAGFSLDSTHDAYAADLRKKKVRGSQDKARRPRRAENPSHKRAPAPHRSPARPANRRRAGAGRPSPSTYLDALPVRDVLPQIRVTVDLHVLRRLVEVLGARVAVDEPAPYVIKLRVVPV